MTKWNDFLKDYAIRNQICYHCAMASKQARDEYELGYEIPVIPNIKKALRGRVTPAELARIPPRVLQSAPKKPKETKKERTAKIMKEQFGF